MPQALITTTVAAGPTPLSLTVKEFRSLKVIACKGLAGPATSPNAARVNLGNSPAAGEQPFDMTPGTERSFDAPTGMRLNLQRWFLTVQADGDGVVLMWT